MLKPVIFAFLTFNAMAEVELAWRDPNIDYTVYEARALRSETQKVLWKSALRSAVKLDSAVLPAATAWTRVELHERFQRMRDERFLQSVQSNFPRRASWLYPDDGCYARAALANRNLFRWFLPVPSKVFVFGNLRVKTPNAPRGAVSWWYHVAPVVDVNGEKFVLDPAIEPSKPLPLNEWLARMGKPERMKVSICGSGTYTPGDNCSKETDGMEKSAERAQAAYLKLEWQRLKRLGRSAEQELGENPPWK